MRGRLHSAAAWFFGGSSLALTAIAASNPEGGFMTVATAVYSLCLVGMLMVSAVYHRAPWRTEAAVAGWRRADHAMIAVFIAGTYGPLVVGTYDSEWWRNGPGGWTVGGLHLGAMGGLWILAVAWIAAIGIVILNIAWLTHPRWLATGAYLFLGWLAVLCCATLAQTLGPVVFTLVLTGGFVYSVGAIIYAIRWPNFSERWFGFHELFHATTIAAALLHHIAMWIVVLPPLVW